MCAYVRASEQRQHFVEAMKVSANLHEKAAVKKRIRDLHEQQTESQFCSTLHCIPSSATVEYLAIKRGLEQQQHGFELTTPLQTPTARPSIVQRW
jgi:hypothetical protein